MYQVAVLPPPAALGAVEDFRRLHDPAFHRLPPHLPLLPPFEPIRTDFIGRFDETLADPFRARLGRPVADGGALCLSLIEGVRGFRRARSRLADALLDPAASRTTTPPLLRVGVLPTADELELARRALAAMDQLPHFRVTQLSLLMEDVRGIWHVVRERSLG